MTTLSRSIKRFLIAAAAVLTAGNAAALSCLPGSPERSFNDYESSPDQYYIFQGSFQPLQSVPPGSNYTERGSQPTVLYRFEGRAIGPNGLLPDTRSFELTVSPQCAGPWCAGYPAVGDAIYFLKYENNRYSYEPTPCPGSQLQATATTRRALVDCFAGICVDTSLPQPPAPEPEPVPADTCGADLLQGFVGQRVSALPPFVAASSKVRIYGQGDPVTMDYRLDRLNIELNGRNRIQRIRCG